MSSLTRNLDPLKICGMLKLLNEISNLDDLFVAGNYNNGMI